MRLLFLFVLGITSINACTKQPAFVLNDLAYPNVEGSVAPHLMAGPTGTGVLSWLEPSSEGHALKFASYSGDEWSIVSSVRSGPNLMANWADFPSVVPVSRDFWVAHWLVLQGGNSHGYDAVAAFSRDGGKHWGAPFLLHEDMTATEHGFVSLFPWNDGVGAVWLDGRNMIVDGEPAFVGATGEPLGMSLRYAQFSEAGDRQLSGVVDQLVCDCCQTDTAIANGDIVLAYRDRTPGDIRDVVVRRLEQGKWTEPYTLGPDGWFFPGCPINGPAIAADGDEVVVAWFAAPNDEPKVRLARSSDGGRSFSDPVDLDTTGSFGHVDVALLQGGTAAVSWVRREGENQTALTVRLISADGVPGKIHVIARSNTSRPLDFPQMVSSSRSLVFAWTGLDGDGIQTARLDLTK
ncbi:MAG: sialidase family protein [Pseudomonadota bacterium]|nr:sialidase family protein [Pseudomonadota bacterium]